MPTHDPSVLARNRQSSKRCAASAIAQARTRGDQWRLGAAPTSLVTMAIAATISRSGWVRSGSAGGCAVQRFRPMPPWRQVSELETRADVHHRSASRVDRADDLLDIDPLQANARGRDVRMPELALIHRQRHPLPGELDRVSTAELMRRQPAPHPRSGAAHRASRSPTTAASASARRSRRTTHRPAARPGRRATERGDRSTPTRPSRPHGGDCLCLGGSESILVAGRDLTRSTTALSGSAARRLTAPRSATATAVPCLRRHARKARAGGSARSPPAAPPPSYTGRAGACSPSASAGSKATVSRRSDASLELARCTDVPAEPTRAAGWSGAQPVPNRAVARTGGSWCGASARSVATFVNCRLGGQ